jgi:hypothetical protein
VAPHDLDMMFIPKHHQPGEVAQARCLDVPALALEYKNRGREILDLFCEDASTNGGQIGQLVAELAGMICPPGQARNWAELDEAVWNWNPRNNQRGEFYVTPYRDHRFGGAWERNLVTPDFAGSCKYIVDFCTDSRPGKRYRPNDGDQRGYGFGYLAYETKDSQIPARPAARYTGGKNFPGDSLAFETSDFSSPSGASMKSIQWRVAEIAAPGLPGFVSGQRCLYEIEPGWTLGEVAGGSKELRVPAGVCRPGHTYRGRVRHEDNAGRWSHWSPAIEFTAKR